MKQLLYVLKHIWCENLTKYLKKFFESFHFPFLHIGFYFNMKERWRSNVFNKIDKIKSAKLARLKKTGKLGCTVSVFNMSVVIVVRLF